MIVVSPIDIQIIERLSKGFVIKEISQQLGVDVRTVHNHLYHLRQLFQAKTLVHLIGIFLASGFISMDGLGWEESIGIQNKKIRNTSLKEIEVLHSRTEISGDSQMEGR